MGSDQHLVTLINCIVASETGTQDGGDCDQKQTLKAQGDILKNILQIHFFFVWRSHVTVHIMEIRGQLWEDGTHS